MSKTSASFTSKWVMFIHFPQGFDPLNSIDVQLSLGAQLLPSWSHDLYDWRVKVLILGGSNNVDVCQLSMVFSWCQTDQTVFVWVGNMMTLASVSEDSETHREFGGVIFKLLTHHEFNLLCSGLRQWVTSNSSLTTSSLCSRWGAICVAQITTRRPKGRQITRRPDIGNLLVWFTM